MRSSNILRNFNRMLDLGGMPMAATSKNALLDVSKNCKVRCLAFDFDLLTRSVVEMQPLNDAAAEPTPQAPVPSQVIPDVSMLQKMADLLNVKLGQSVSTKRIDDDLSALIGGATKGTTPTTNKAVSNPAPSYTDIRNKYANKLRNQGGIAGIELAKSQSEHLVVKGDATSHLAARAMAINAGKTSMNASEKWMAQSGTGALLQFIKLRSMKIALLPVPGNDKASIEANRMEEFTKQISHIPFDVVLKEGKTVEEILQELRHQIDLEPFMFLVVSDQDRYLQTAKNEGMTTCRVRPHSNSPHGNTTAHYTISSMAEVQDVLNEINGISFKAGLIR